MLLCYHAWNFIQCQDLQKTKRHDLNQPPGHARQNGCEWWDSNPCLHKFFGI